MTPIDTRELTSRTRVQKDSAKTLTPNALELREVRVLVPLRRRLDGFWGAVPWKRPEPRRHTREGFEADELPRFIRTRHGACRGERFDGHSWQSALDLPSEHRERAAHSCKERAYVRSTCGTQERINRSATSYEEGDSAISLRTYRLSSPIEHSC